MREYGKTLMVVPWNDPKARRTDKYYILCPHEFNDRYILIPKDGFENEIAEYRARYHMDD